MTTLASEDAQKVATTDREATAELVLTAGCRDAVALLRADRPGRAEYVLTRAGVSAARILGGSS